MTAALNGLIKEYESQIEELKALVEEQKKQIIKFDNQYRELLEMIVEDLDEDGLTKEEMLRFYNKKLWSQKK